MADEQQGQLGTPLPGQRYYVSGFNIMSSSDGEVIVIASSPIAAANAEGVIGIGMMPAAQLTMSWVAFKELSLLIQTQLAAREAQAGKITSDWINAHEQAKGPE